MIFTGIMQADYENEGVIPVVSTLHDCCVDDVCNDIMKLIVG